MTRPIASDTEIVAELSKLQVIETLRAQRDELAEALKRICYDYCRWYDTGEPAGYDGAGMAYHLVNTARAALAKVEDRNA